MLVNKQHKISEVTRLNYHKIIIFVCFNVQKFLFEANLLYLTFDVLCNHSSVKNIKSDVNKNGHVLFLFSSITYDSFVYRLNKNNIAIKLFCFDQKTM